MLPIHTGQSGVRRSVNLRIAACCDEVSGVANALLEIRVLQGFFTNTYKKPYAVKNT
jgi:hypothetical protein